MPSTTEEKWNLKYPEWADYEITSLNHRSRWWVIHNLYITPINQMRQTELKILNRKLEEMNQSHQFQIRYQNQTDGVDRSGSSMRSSRGQRGPVRWPLKTRRAASGTTLCQTVSVKNSLEALQWRMKIFLWAEGLENEATISHTLTKM